MEDIWGRNENQEISKEVAGLLYSAKYGLPTHKEMQDSLLSKMPDILGRKVNKVINLETL